MSLLQVYLLVQEQKPGVYEIFKRESCLINPDDRVEALLDDARSKVCMSTEIAPNRIMLEAYSLVNPMPSFTGKTFSSLVEQVGKLDVPFFETKAIRWSACDPFSGLGATDGKVIVVFRTSGKRLASDSETTFERMKRSRLATTSPSTFAQPSYYEAVQQAFSEKILDDRPTPDPDIPPIPLLYNGFGQFLDILDGGTDVPGLSQVDILELERAVDDLAEKMCLYYFNEDARKTAALPVLDRIFSARAGTKIPSLQAAAIGSLRSDGHNVAEHGGGALLAEFKNRSAGNNAIAEVELTGYVARLNATGMNEHKDLFKSWRVPSLGLTVVGTDVRFYGIVAIDHQHRLVNLTPCLSCIYSASDGRDRIALYRAFAAASVLQARILEDAHTFISKTPPEILPSARRFPAVTRLRKWDSPTDYLSFQILAFHPDRRNYRFLYFAETTGPEKQTIIVKFARTYSIELHAFCSERSFAPHILAFERLAGGWNAIAMEDTWMAVLLELVDGFHAKGLVHGDLRDANIIIYDDLRVMLLDFDWGGKDGQVFYPTSNLNRELLEGRSSNDLKITQDDDNRVLKKTLEKLKK